MFDPQVTIVGNLVADPQLIFTKDGHARASFRLAATQRRLDRATGEWRDGDSIYANVTCWRGLAENVCASLHRGQGVLVVGRISLRPYETRDGARRESVEIDASAVGADLTRAIAMMKRAERGVPVSLPAAPDGAPSPAGMAGEHAGPGADGLGSSVALPDATAPDAGSGFGGSADDLVVDLEDDLEDDLVDDELEDQADGPEQQTDPEPVGVGDARRKGRFGLG